MTLGDERDPDFQRLLAAQTVSMAGTAITDVALPLALVAFGASSFEFGVVFALKTGPRLFALIFAAPIADRYRRRAVLVACDLVRAAVLATVPLAALLGVLAEPQLFGIALLLGIADVIATTSSRAYLPILVRRDALIACNSRLEAGTRVSTSVMSGVAGLLVRALTAPYAMGLDALSYLASATLLRGIRRAEPPPPRPEGGWLAQLREGLRMIVSDPVLRAVVLSLGAMNLGVALLYAQLAHFLADILAFSPELVGLTFAMFSVGALLATFVRGARWPGHVILAAGVLLCALASGGLALTGDRLPAACALPAVLLLGFGSSVFLIRNVTMRQTLPPTNMLGRVNAAAIMFGPGLAAIGALAGGGVADRVGMRTLFAGNAVYLVLGAAWIAASSLRYYSQRVPSHDSR